MPACEITVNFPLSDMAALEKLFGLISSLEAAEVWVNDRQGKSLAVYKHGSKAFLMFLSEDGGAGFSSRNPATEGDNTPIPIYMKNGQGDERLSNEMVPVTSAFQAIEYFAEHREKAPGIHWHDDSLGQDQ
jgi:hypothetical protein